jgi:type II secretory pathway pseudopilin PulG
MDISKRNNYKNEGFTLMELIVVVAGLAILSSLSIPNILGRIQLNRTEEAKALMNSFALDCLGKYRISTDPANFIENATPDELNNERLSTLQYQIDGEKNKCSHVAIKPLNEKEKDLFAFDFRISSDGQILKTAIPSDNPKFLNSCRSWAGKNCGLSKEQIAEFAKLAELAKAKAACDSGYSVWLAEGNSGEYVAWNSDKEDCTRPVFAFEGKPVNSIEAVNLALKEKYGRACAEWTESKKDSISPNGDPETKDPECGGVQYWFHTGNIFTTKAMWDAHDNLLKYQVCIDNRQKALQAGVKGKYTYNPAGPPPCGKVVWLCNGEEYDTLESYKTTSCGATPPPPINTIPPHCVNFRAMPFCSQMRRPIGPNCVCS